MTINIMPQYSTFPEVQAVECCPSLGCNWGNKKKTISRFPVYTKINSPIPYHTVGHKMIGGAIYVWTKMVYISNTRFS